MATTGIEKVNLRDKLAHIDSFWNPHIVPRKTEHCPVAASDECHVMLIERKSTLNTGTVETERTRHDLQRI